MPKTWVIIAPMLLDFLSVKSPCIVAQMIKECFQQIARDERNLSMNRITGSCAISTTLGESVRVFQPHPLPPADPALSPAAFMDLHRHAELALARLAGVSGLVPSVDWLL